MRTPSRSLQHIWPPDTPPEEALRAAQEIHEQLDAMRTAYGQLLQAAVDVATGEGWSSEKIANYLGMSRSHIARLRPTGPAVRVVIRIAEPTARNSHRVTSIINEIVAGQRAKGCGTADL